MKTALEICIALLMIGVPLHLYYWYVLRVAALVKIRFDLERLRHKIQNVETNREGQAGVSVLLKKTDWALRCLSDFDIMVAVVNTPPPEIKLQIDRDAEIVADAPVDIRELHRELERLIASSAVINSPGVVALCLALTPFVILIAVGCLIVGKAKNIWSYLDRRLWANVYYQPKAC